MKSNIINMLRLVQLIDEPNRSICVKFINDNIERLTQAKGSAVKHQAWPGGYVDHVNETMEIACMLYNTLNTHRKLPFSLSDTLIVLFLHDIEKPWKHVKNGINFSKTDAAAFREDKISEYGFQISLSHFNALVHVEGEKDYHPTIRRQGPLAAFVHCCDTLSARLWFDMPNGTN